MRIHKSSKKLSTSNVLCVLRMNSTYSHSSKRWNPSKQRGSCGAAFAMEEHTFTPR